MKKSFKQILIVTFSCLFVGFVDIGYKKVFAD